MLIQPVPRQCSCAVLCRALQWCGRHGLATSMLCSCVIAACLAMMMLCCSARTTSARQQFETLLMNPVPAGIEDLQYGSAVGVVDSSAWGFRFTAPADVVQGITSKFALRLAEGGPEAAFWKRFLEVKLQLDMDDRLSYTVYTAHSARGVLRLFWHQQSGVVFVFWSSV